MVRTVIVILATVVLSGCIRADDFAQQSVKQVPSHFTARNRLPDPSGGYRHRLAELPGRILYMQAADSEFEFRGVLLGDYQPKLEIIPDNEGQVFEGIIDNKIALDASYIGLGTAVSRNDLATLEIKDRLISAVPTANIPWDRLAEEAELAKPASVVRRYWIQWVLLATLDYKVASEVDLKAGGKLTEAFGANGKVYNKAQTSVHDYRLSVELIDIDNVTRRVVREIESSLQPRDSTRLRTLVLNLRPPQLRSVRVLPSIAFPPHERGPSGGPAPIP